MLKTEKNIVVDAPVEQVFEYLSDLARMHEYAPDTDEMKGIQRLPDGRSTYAGASKVLGVRADWQCEQIEVIPNERIVRKGESAVMDFTLTFRFKRMEDRKTHVSIVSENTFHGMPMARLGETYFDHGVEMAMNAAKARIEAGALATAAR